MSQELRLDAGERFRPGGRRRGESGDPNDAGGDPAIEVLAKKDPKVHLHATSIALASE